MSPHLRQVGNRLSILVGSIATSFRRGQQYLLLFIPDDLMGGPFGLNCKYIRNTLRLSLIGRRYCGRPQKRSSWATAVARKILLQRLQVPSIGLHFAALQGQQYIIFIQMKCFIRNNRYEQLDKYDKVWKVGKLTKTTQMNTNSE